MHLEVIFSGEKHYSKGLCLSSPRRSARTLRLSQEPYAVTRELTQPGIGTTNHYTNHLRSIKSICTVS